MTLRIPGCPDGTKIAVRWLEEHGEGDFETDDEGCVAILKVLLPLLGYGVEVKKVDGLWRVVVKKKTSHLR